MQKNKLNLMLADNIDSTSLNEQFKRDGYVKVAKALSDESAELLTEKILAQRQWNLVFNKNGQHQDLDNLAVSQWPQEQKDVLEQIIYTQAGKGFQYHYETIPIYDIYQNNLMPEHFFNEIIEFLNSATTLNFFRKLLSAPEISFIDGQITKFSSGHFLNCHNDDVNNKNRLAAMVINLTKNWRADWGGALHLLDKNQQISTSFVPSFNEINIFKIPVDHYVGFVSPFAQSPRLSITCWLRFGENPLRSNIKK